MKANLMFVALAVLLIAGVVIAHPANERYVEPGMFSFYIPQGWLLREIPGARYKVAFGRPAGGFAPNINVVDEPFAGSLEQYIAANMAMLPKAYQAVGNTEFQVLSKTAVLTALRRTGIRVRIQFKGPNGRMMRQTFYAFDGNRGRKFVVTCSVLADGGENYDTLFDAAMSTFEAAE